MTVTYPQGPDPVYPDEDEFLAEGDSYFTGTKMLEWDDTLGIYTEEPIPDGS
jgi:hypothetical protein|tara:strand:+ start:867 stop:1022 length:156 start_codon:yes stop_codon:yes gene_type:complete